MQVLYRLAVVIVFLIALPVMGLIALFIIFDSGLPILFRQIRVGKNNIHFLIYKFRTMRVGADCEQARLKHLNEANGPVFKIHNDPRFTRIGKFLAHTGLDELPQLINVIRGDMALIGPRPLPVDEAKKLTPRQMKRHVIKPGIISPWILEGYHKQSFEAWMKSDIAYSKEKTFLYDVVLARRCSMLLITLLSHELS
ncbi:MAG TPA: sugar transferase [Patescibacteria group bacterium]|nr:sugar transferase [Patescibacteria group bacterium]